MSVPARFLTALAQAVSTMHLYRPGHPAWERAVDTAFERLQDLQGADPRARFTFLDEEIVFGERPLRDLRDWDWASRLSRAGIQRIELVGPVSREELEEFLDEVVRVLTGSPLPSSERRQTHETGIRYGRVRLDEEDEPPDEEERPPDDSNGGTLDYSFREEAEGLEWIQEELRERDELHLLEAEAIVRSLSVAMHGDQDFLIPLLRLKRFDQYTTTHALNVSVLAMALSEHIGLGPGEVRSFGISGLLHDLGKTRIPKEILNKPGRLTEEERAAMNAHTVEGARLILEADHHLDLAAVVAYEHHIRIDGGGYPDLAFSRTCHQCSNLVHVCDVYDALRTNRPYRSAWPEAKVLDYIREGAGTEFDLRLAHAFCEMMEHWGSRVAVLESEEQPVRGALPHAQPPADA